jgi:hypothetical protein
MKNLNFSFMQSAAGFTNCIAIRFEALGRVVVAVDCLVAVDWAAAATFEVEAAFFGWVQAKLEPIWFLNKEK